LDDSFLGVSADAMRAISPPFDSRAAGRSIWSCVQPNPTDP